MLRAFSIAFSLAAVVLSAVLAFRDAPSLASTASAPTTPLDAGASVMVVDAESAGAKVGPSAAAQPELTPAATEAMEAPTAEALGKSAPREVRLGVVLVTYAGAEGAPEKGARRKTEALALATKIADEAHQSSADFRTVVQHGDTGSADDIGVVTRGVLEPEAEAAIFTLPVGGVSGVIDTPRGFWIVKRLE